MTPLLWLAWGGAAIASLALALTLLNLLTWPRGRADRAPLGGARISVLIPARNEERTLEAAVRSALAAGAHEVWVCDDGSTDRTPEILARLSQEDARVRSFQGAALPEGWAGKVHACAQLAERAGAERLVWMDADVTLQPWGLRRLLSLHETHRADVVTAVPRQITGTWLEHLVLPLLHFTYVSWLPLPLIWKSRDPRFLAANGQLLSLSREALTTVGGWASIRGAIVDDMALCRRAKERGLRVVFADGFHMANCRMYNHPRQVWEGFSKNLFEGLGGSVVLLTVVIALHAIGFLLPWVLLAWEPTRLPAAIALLATFAQRSVMALRWRHPLWSPFAHPAAVIALLAIAINSARWSLIGKIRWSGRSYAPRALGEHG